MQKNLPNQSTLSGPASSGTTPAPVAFEGICVHLAADISIPQDTPITNWAVSESAQFYTNSSFNLTTGEYQVAREGHFNLEASLYPVNNSFYFAVNGIPIAKEFSPGATGSVTMAITAYFDQNDIITLRSTDNPGNFDKYANGVICSFWSVTRNDQTINLVTSAIQTKVPSSRYNCDPSSNPDPFTGGLIVTSAQCQTPAIFTIPLTSTGVFPGSASAYDDSRNFWTLNSNVITFNRTGEYTLGFDMDALANRDDISCVLQISSFPIFAGPPICSESTAFTTTIDPASGIPFAFSMSSGTLANIKVNQGDSFTLQMTCTSFNPPPYSLVIYPICSVSIMALIGAGVPDTPVLYPLTAGTGCTITPSPYDPTVGPSVIDVPVPIVTTLNTAGSGGSESLVNAGVGPFLATKGLLAGTGVTLSSTATDVTISASSAVTLTSTGIGQSLVSDGVGPDLSVKSLVNGTGITVTSNATQCTISATSTSLASSGGTVSLVSDGTGPSLAVKGLTAGAGISLTDGGTSVTITNSAGNPVNISSISPLVILNPANITGVGTVRIRSVSFNYVVNVDVAFAPGDTINTWTNVGFPLTFSVGMAPFGGVLTVPYSGAYQISARVTSTDNSTISRVTVNTVGRISSQRSIVGTYSYNDINGIIYLDANDVVRIVVDQSTTVVRDTPALPQATYGYASYWSMSFIGPIS